MNIEKLHNNVMKAAAELRKAMMVEWPVGAIVRVKLNSKQKYLTNMTVYSHDGYNATVRVGMECKNSRRGNYVRDIYYQNIL